MITGGPSVVTGGPPGKQLERPHPATPLIRGWLLLVAIVIGFGRELIPDGRSGDGFQSADLHWLLPVFGGAVVLAAIGGFASWYFTHFVIDDDELRIETGALFRRSTKVTFERLQSIDVIQPLAARPFGLVELRIETGAGDSALKLRYLTKVGANRLRAYLLARAHGERPSVTAETGLPPSSFTDLSQAHHPLVVVPARRLIGGFLVSTEWLLTLSLIAALLTFGSRFPVVSFLIPTVIPLVIGAFTMISRRVITMFGFTLAESAHGLRVARGLANLTSQSVPLDRVQGLAISQSLLWRPFGWYRVDIDVLGYAAGDKENDRHEATSVLLPVASAAEVQLAVARVLPGSDLPAIELHRPPRQVAALRWFDFWTLRYGWDDRVIVTEHGWLTWVRDVVPHAKTQSVRIKQGPLQRAIGVADVHVDTTRGPVDAVLRHVEAAVARELVMSQLGRARDARLRGKPGTEPSRAELTGR